jgi:integrase
MPKCLSDTAVRNAKPKAKPYKMSDGEGLFLQVMPSGSKYWRFKYSFAGKEKLLAFGVYPDVTLSDARDRRAKARRILAGGGDPGEVKKEAKRLLAERQASTFEDIAREWHQNRSDKWTPVYAKKMFKSVERHLLSKVGTRPIADITTQELLTAMRSIEEHGADLAHRQLQICGQIFSYAVMTQRTTMNPALPLRGALKPVVKRGYAYIKPNELQDYLARLEAYDGSLQTKLAMRFLLLTFVRTGELRKAMWSEIVLDKAEWRIPAERMKMRESHIVPLSRQAIGILKELQPITGQRAYVFPNQHKPSTYMSENTILYALYRMGYHSRATGHGFRSTASTILNENGFMPDVIERQLAHNDRNKVRAAYNHAQYLSERRMMMQWWADYLDEVAAKAPK